MVVARLRSHKNYGLFFAFFFMAIHVMDKNDVPKGAMQFVVRGQGATITGTNGASFLAYGTIPDWNLGAMFMDKHDHKSSVQLRRVGSHAYSTLDDHC